MNSRSVVKINILFKIGVVVCCNLPMEESQSSSKFLIKISTLHLWPKRWNHQLQTPNSTSSVSIGTVYRGVLWNWLRCHHPCRRRTLSKISWTRSPDTWIVSPNACHSLPYTCGNRKMDPKPHSKGILPTSRRRCSQMPSWGIKRKSCRCRVAFNSATILSSWRITQWLSFSRDIKVRSLSLFSIWEMITTTPQCNCLKLTSTSAAQDTEKILS